MNAEDVKFDIAHISKKYGAFKALDDVTLDVKQGEFLTLLGPSTTCGGPGFSTELRRFSVRLNCLKF